MPWEAPSREPFARESRSRARYVQPPASAMRLGPGVWYRERDSNPHGLKARGF